MKEILRATCLVLVLLVDQACQRATETQHQHDAGNTVKADTIKKSIPKEIHASVSGAHFTIRYHAPAIRGRTIWGGLVPYGEVWVTGAHSATTVEFDRDIMLNDQRIVAGKYALFTIPDTTTWTVIINSNWDQHLADEYDSKDDIIRAQVTPSYADKAQERLTYTIADKGNSEGVIGISWEKIRVALPFRVQ
ncbi:MAG TPA: DUF2911 domain-containing protein [Chryseosolibacter sp.]|nr:DUF2911 domain-containing protein [Chryseosolibacter sp.]